jgi:hypothetical protein
MDTDEVVVGDGDDAGAEVAAAEAAVGLSEAAADSGAADAGAEGSGDEGSGAEGENAEGQESEGAAAAGEKKPAKKSKLPPEIQEEIDARIGKEVGKRKELEERLERAEARARELEEAAEDREAAGERRPGTGLGAMSERELAKRQAELEGFLEWADEALQEMGTDPEAKVKVGETEFTREEIKAKRSAFRRELRQDIPAAVAAGKEKARLRETVVKEAYPELLQAGSEEALTLRRTARMFPDLASHPMFEVIVGDMLAGEKLRTQKKAGKPAGGGQGAKPAPIPKTAAAGAPAAAAGAGAAPKKKVNLSRIAEGNEDDLVEELMNEG